MLCNAGKGSRGTMSGTERTAMLGGYFVAGLIILVLLFMVVRQYEDAEWMRTTAVFHGLAEYHPTTGRFRFLSQNEVWRRCQDIIDASKKAQAQADEGREAAQDDGPSCEYPARKD